MPLIGLWIVLFYSTRIFLVLAVGIGAALGGWYYSPMLAGFLAIGPLLVLCCLVAEMFKDLYPRANRMPQDNALENSHE